MYDAVFALENRDMGGADVLEHRWEHNMLKGNDYEPFLREAYMDLSLNKFEARLGRQFVAWGKSDGVYMLDLLHPFNYRNPTIFEEEDVNIPLWMINLNYWFTGEDGLQFISGYPASPRPCSPDTYPRRWGFTTGPSRASP